MNAERDHVEIGKIGEIASKADILCNISSELKWLKCQIKNIEVSIENTNSAIHYCEHLLGGLIEDAE